jgi:hypothetical protein
VLPVCGVAKDSKEIAVTEDFPVNQDYEVLLECTGHQDLKEIKVSKQSNGIDGNNLTNNCNVWQMIGFELQCLKFSSKRHLSMSMICVSSCKLLLRLSSSSY